MSTKKALLIGCGTATLVAVMLLGLLVGWFIYISQDIEGLSISIDSPLDVKVGETFKMTVNVKNEREKNALTVSDIDISDDYMEGFVTIATEPKPKSTMHVPIDNSMSHTFNTRISAGETKAFIFTLRSEKPGIFRGDLDVCEGSRFITVTAQTVAKD